MPRMHLWSHRVGSDTPSHSTAGHYVVLRRDAALVERGEDLPLADALAERDVDGDEAAADVEAHLGLLHRIERARDGEVGIELRSLYIRVRKTPTKWRGDAAS